MFNGSLKKLKRIEPILPHRISNMNEPMDCQPTDCPACGDMHGEPMMYCGAFLTPHQVTEMECADADIAETETIDSEMSEPPPPPPPMQRQIALGAA